MAVHRRQLLAGLVGGGSAFAVGASGWGTHGGSPRPAWRADALGLQSLAHLANPTSLQLLPPDRYGLKLLPGFSARVVAMSDAPVRKDSAFVWHRAADGGACFALPRGWIYVSNSEGEGTAGGASAIRFDPDGQLIDAYPILRGTSRNCAGGPTPWGTWLSGEEVERGLIWECDPRGVATARAWPALGSFRHEAAAVDPVGRAIYLTEDEYDGCLYRFRPTQWPNLTSGVLEAAEAIGSASDERKLRWHRVANPNPSSFQLETRRQVPKATRFRGGEGIWWHAGVINFTTKWDHRVWALDTHRQRLRVRYDGATANPAPLRGVDNLVIDRNGRAFVAEDGDDMQLVLVGDGGLVLPIVQVVDQDGSELAGPAFSPDYSRLYVSSQRGPGALGPHGITYEISGPWLTAGIGLGIV
jgi:uncharacterized protein